MNKNIKKILKLLTTLTLIILIKTTVGQFSIGFQSSAAYPSLSAGITLTPFSRTGIITARTNQALFLFGTNDTALGTGGLIDTIWYLQRVTLVNNATTGSDSGFACLLTTTEYDTNFSDTVIYTTHSFCVGGIAGGRTPQTYASPTPYMIVVPGTGTRSHRQSNCVVRVVRGTAVAEPPRTTNTVTVQGYYMLVPKRDL